MGRSRDIRVLKMSDLRHGHGLGLVSRLPLLREPRQPVFYFIGMSEALGPCQDAGMITIPTQRCRCASP